jgi:hypothetical protein
VNNLIDWDDWSRDLDQLFPMDPTDYVVYLMTEAVPASETCVCLLLNEDERKFPRICFTSIWYYSEI